MAELLIGRPRRPAPAPAGNATIGVVATNARPDRNQAARVATMVPLRMFPVAIGSGNTFILESSEQGSSPSLQLADLLHEERLHPVENHAVVPSDGDLDLTIDAFGKVLNDAGLPMGVAE
jgi:L-aminopeptidase/D-esterase-like protein